MREQRIVDLTVLLQSRYYPLGGGVRFVSKLAVSLLRDGNSGWLEFTD